MGILDFFKGRKTPPPPTPVSHLPARAPRVTLAPLHHVSFDLTQPMPVKDLAIANLSWSGMGLLKEGFNSWPPAGSKISGQLKLQEMITPITLQIVHTTVRVVGCRFFEPPSTLPALIDRYFQVELSAIELHRIDDKYIKKQPDGDTYWFRGANNCELYIVATGDSIARFNLSFLGHSIDYSLESQIKYGVEEEQTAFGIQYKGVELVRPLSSIPPEICAAATKFINNIKELPPKQQNLIGAILQDSSN